MSWGRQHGYFEVEQLIVVEVDAHGKIQPCVSLVDDLEVVELSRHLRTSRKFVYFDPRATIILWISDCSLTFSLSS